MTNEQREAVETMQHWIEYEKEHKNEINKADKLIRIQDTVLSLIKEQEGETDKYKALYERALSDLVKADKQIDLMVEQLAGLTIWNIEEDEPMILGDKEEVKQYFADLVEKE